MPEAGGAGEREAAGILPGTLIADRYRVERLLGEGGMGAVYRAEHVHMRKAVAVKVLHPDALEFPEVVARFEREAIASAHIVHPNVVSATDFGKLPDGSFFLVLEFVDGESLRDVIARGAMAQNQALHIVREIGSALVVAHRSGVVHRDLKPENVMLVAPSAPAADGTGLALESVKVFDFGIAKIDVGSVTGKQGSTLQPLTRVGTVFGTPDYMPPEQAMGQPVDGRADLYALGVMLYEMLTGNRPYKGGAVTLMRQHILNDVPELPSEVAGTLDARVADILKKLLAKDVGDRYPSATAMLEAIDAILGRPNSAPPTAVSSPASSPIRLSPVPGSADAAVGTAPTTLQTPPDKTYAPVARSAYSAEGASSKRKKRALFGTGAFIALVVAGGVALSSMHGASPAGNANAHRPHPTATASAFIPADPAASGESAASEGAPKSASTSTKDDLAPSSASADPASSASADPAASSAPDDAPSPAKPAAGQGRDNPRTAPRSGRGGKRRTGPGGIYIPPPKDWIK